MVISEKDGVFSLDACAKINLFLRMVGKRPDGYHDIYTLFVPVSLYDTLKISHSEKMSLSCSDKNIPDGADNIIMKTDAILRERYGLKACFDVELQKRIPTGAGLGGGSSDAAAYLLLADRAASLGLSYDDMKDVMASVGSDTVFFIKSVPAIGRGRGDVLTEYRGLPPLYFVVVNPQIHVSTKLVYTSGNLDFTGSAAGGMKHVMDFDDVRALMANDMERAVFTMYPDVAALKDSMKGVEGGAVLMSGSGSTVFGVYKDEDSCDRAYRHFAALWPHYFVKKLQSIERKGDNDGFFSFQR